MTHYTTVNQILDEAPKRRVLRGDKKLKSEPATHVVEFPGGAIELSRLDDGTYWAHIILNREPLFDTNDRGLRSAQAEVVESRIDWGERRIEIIPSLPDEAHLTQIAVRIRPVTGGAA